MRARDENGAGMTDVALRDEMMTLLVAGQETSAILLAWASACLAHNPAVQAAVQAEVDAILGGVPPDATNVRCVPFSWVVVFLAGSSLAVLGFDAPRGLNKLPTSLLVAHEWVFSTLSPRMGANVDIWSDGVGRTGPLLKYWLAQRRALGVVPDKFYVQPLHCYQGVGGRRAHVIMSLCLMGCLLYFNTGVWIAYEHFRSHARMHPPVSDVARACVLMQIEVGP